MLLTYSATQRPNLLFKNGERQELRKGRVCDRVFGVWFAHYAFKTSLLLLASPTLTTLPLHF